MIFPMRLLPPGHTFGLTPFAWLAYLGFFLVYPFLADSTTTEWALMFVGVAIFLALYFRAYWVSGARLLAIVAAITLLGIMYAPINAGASAFFIYASAFAAETGPPRRAMVVIGAIVAASLIEAGWLDLPPWFWIPAAVISIVVGGVNIHWAEQRRVSARLRAVQDEMAAVAERDRIARDLHDLLGHNLSMIVLKSELATKLFERQPDRAKDEIAQVETISRETLSRVREAVTGFTSRDLDQEVAALKQNLESAGIRTRTDVQELSLTRTSETVAALFLREASTNIIRHSGARRAWIEIAQTDGLCRIVIGDDGRGGIREEGFGMRGMRARVEALGGVLELDSSSGTTLVATIPGGVHTP